MATSMFSTKGRYALRAMVDLATHDGWVSLGDVSERQNISRKYLEQVIALMHRAGYVESLRGKGGGYRLTRAPEDYTLGEILRAAEGSLAPVACLQCTNDEICPQVFDCPTVKVWAGLGHVTSEYLDSKTLADILPTAPAAPAVPPRRSPIPLPTAPDPAQVRTAPSSKEPTPSCHDSIVARALLRPVLQAVLRAGTTLRVGSTLRAALRILLRVSRPTSRTPDANFQ